MIPPSFKMISSISILRWKASGLINAKVPCKCKCMDQHTHQRKWMQMGNLEILYMLAFLNGLHLTFLLKWYLLNYINAN